MNMKNIYQNNLDLVNKYNLTESVKLKNIFNSLTASIVDKNKNTLKETNLDKTFLISFLFFLFNSNPKLKAKLEKEKNSENDGLVPEVYVENKPQILKISQRLILENQNRIKIFSEKNSIIMLISLNHIIDQYDLSEYLPDHKFEDLYFKIKIKQFINPKIGFKNIYLFWLCQKN